MEDQDRYKLIAEFQEYLESGRNDATPEQLRSWLIATNQGAIPNETVRHRAIINGFTINYLRMDQTIEHLEKTIERLDADSARTQKLVIVLTYVTIIVGIAQIVVPLLLR